jgi:hypothetical protein
MMSVPELLMMLRSRRIVRERSTVAPAAEKEKAHGSQSVGVTGSDGLRRVPVGNIHQLGNFLASQRRADAAATAAKLEPGRGRGT